MAQQHHGSRCQLLTLTMDTSQGVPRLKFILQWLLMPNLQRAAANNCHWDAYQQIYCLAKRKGLNRRGNIPQMPRSYYWQVTRTNIGIHSSTESATQFPSDVGICKRSNVTAQTHQYQKKLLAYHNSKSQEYLNFNGLQNWCCRSTIIICTEAWCRGSSSTLAWSTRYFHKAAID